MYQRPNSEKLKNIGQCDIENTYDVKDKNNNVSFEIEGLAAILAIISVSIFITAVNLYYTIQKNRDACCNLF